MRQIREYSDWAPLVRSFRRAGKGMPSHAAHHKHTRCHEPPGLTTATQAPWPPESSGKTSKIPTFFAQDVDWLIGHRTVSHSRFDSVAALRSLDHVAGGGARYTASKKPDLALSRRTSKKSAACTRRQYRSEGFPRTRVTKRSCACDCGRGPVSVGAFFFILLSSFLLSSSPCFGRRVLLYSSFFFLSPRIVP